MKIIFFLILFVGYGLTSLAQNNIEDFNTWWSINLSKKINKKSDFSLIPQLRLDENSLLVKDAFLDLEYSLEVSDLVKISAGLRTGSKRKTDGFDYRNRLKLDIALGGKVNDFKIQYRVRLQSEIKSIKQNNNYFRNRIKIEYKLSKEIRPFMSLETFTHLNNKEGMLLDGGRYSIGSTYRIDKKKSLKVFYSRDVAYNIKAGENRNILGIGFELGF